MSVEKTIIKNLSWLAISNLITKPIWFIFFIFVVNRLGLTDFGIYSYSIAFTSIFGLVFNISSDQLLIRNIAQNKDLTQKYFNNYISFKIIAFFIIISFIYIALKIINFPERIQNTILLVMIFTIFTNLFIFVRGFFRAYEKIQYEAISIFIEKFSAILLGGAALLFSFGLFGFIFGLIISNLICFIYCIFILFKKINSTKFQLDFSFIKDIIKQSLPFFFIDIFISFYYRLASILILFITLSEDQVGLYNSSYRLIEMYVAIPILLIAPIYPAISKTYKTDPERARQISSKIIKILLLISFSLATIIFFDYYRINQLLFTEKFASGALGLRIIILTTIPLSMNAVFSSILSAINKQKFFALSAGIVSILNIGLATLLIYKFEYVGASIALVVSECLVCGLNFYFVTKFFGNLKIVSYFFKLLLAASSTGLLIIVLQSYNTNIFLTILYSMITLGILYFSFKLLSFKQIKDLIIMIKR